MARQTTIKDRIKRYGFVKWAEVEPLQSDDFKKYNPEQIKKLKTSIVNNGFATPLFIWESKGKSILINSDTGDIVYEPFSGSGTATIAAENTGRKCRSVEIDPGYVAVAIQRWADATGKEPKLING